jgi:hypothetical protein
MGERQGTNTFVLGMEPYLVTLTVPETHAAIWEWCAISFEGSEGPELKVENEAGKKVHSASAVMQYVPGTDAWSQGLALMSQPWVTIITSGGVCWDWEIHGERQGWSPGVTARPRLTQPPAPQSGVWGRLSRSVCHDLLRGQ